MGKLLGVDSVLGMKRWQTVAKIVVALVTIAIVMVSLGGIDKAHAAFWGRSRAADTTQATVKKAGKIAEASPPIVLQELRQALDDYQPQVSILSPRKNDVLADDTVSVRFLVKDLPLFKNETFGLGPHLHVLLDNRPYQAVYDTSLPLVFDNLEPGTHTIRAFASRPWHESFKNEGAFAQTTFHVLTKTQDNSPNPELPLLTYSRPQGTYGAEPILLDFYLTNAPLHLVAQTATTDNVADWRIRCTVNGDSFILDRWQPLYLKGFKPGKNWVQLEYLDDKGNPVPNVFNNTVRLVEYQPNGDDTLAKLVRGELTAADVRGIVDPKYVPPAPATSEPSPEPRQEKPIQEEPALEPTPEPTPEPTIEPTQPSPPSEALPSAPAPTLEDSDRSRPIVPPPLASPEPAAAPRAAPTSAPLNAEPVPPVAEPVVPTPAATPNESLPSEAPAVVEPKPSLPTITPASPDRATSAAPKTLTGQARLRQLGQQLGQYLPQSRGAIAPSSRVAPADSPSKPMPEVESTALPVPLPDSLPPTLPEIIGAPPPEAPSSSAPALSEGNPRDH